MSYEEGDLLLCTVKKIEGASVFLELPDGSQGSMVLSEVAAGRIRNLRAYVFPNKKIVCKVLKVDNGHVELSLRRVTGKERDEILGRSKKEAIFRNLLKGSLKEPSKIITKIEEQFELWEFFEDIKENLQFLEKFITKEEFEKLKKLVSEKKNSEKEIRKKFMLKSDSSEGLSDIKEILDIPECVISYLGSSIFVVSVFGKDFKEAEKKSEEIIKLIEKRAKEKKVMFDIKDLKK